MQMTLKIYWHFEVANYKKKNIFDRILIVY
jgi:hypothetical protein